MAYKVYKHTCPNGKSYIGITRQDERLRWNYGNGYCNQFFGKAVKKYGWANIKHEILEVCETLEEANASEVKYIAHYETMNPEKGYNCTLGGDGSSGHIVSKETRIAQSALLKRMWKDEETRKRFLDHLAKLNLSRKGIKLGEEHKRRIGLSNGIKVDQYSLSGEFIATHPSLMDAARSVGANGNTDIVRCCKGKDVTAHGFVWRYHGEPLYYEKHIERINAWKAMIVENAKAAAAKNCIAIRQEDDEGNLIATYGSAVEAEKATGINRNSIRGCCNGRLKHAGGYVWKNNE